MPIESIDVSTDTLVRVCSKCGKPDTIKLSDLRAGEKVGNKLVLDTIVAPDCSGCGAGEQWIRTWDSVDDIPDPTTRSWVRNSAFAKRRNVVNGLFAHLIDSGNSHPDCRDSHRSETKKPRDIEDMSKPHTIGLPATVVARKLAHMDKEKNR